MRWKSCLWSLPLLFLIWRGIVLILTGEPLRIVGGAVGILVMLGFLWLLWKPLETWASFEAPAGMEFSADKVPTSTLVPQVGALLPNSRNVVRGTIGGRNFVAFEQFDTGDGDRHWTLAFPSPLTIPRRELSFRHDTSIDDTTPNEDVALRYSSTKPEPVTLWNALAASPGCEKIHIGEGVIAFQPDLDGRIDAMAFLTEHGPTLATSVVPAVEGVYTSA